MPSEESTARSFTDLTSTDQAPSQDKIYHILRERILAWHYPPGYHLAEAVICEEFSSSRIPVREALQSLIEQGFVQKRRHQGCFVNQPDVQETQELYDMRMALELYTVESLASVKRPDESWLSKQRAFWERWLHISADESIERQDFVDGDTRFHLGLAEALGNLPILTSLRNINERLRFVRLAAVTNAHRAQETAGEHIAILDALAARDPDAARRGIRQNINHSRNKVELAISRALMKAHSLKA